jgi:hypothetical protein
VDGGLGHRGFAVTRETAHHKLALLSEQHLRRRVAPPEKTLRSARFHLRPSWLPSEPARPSLGPSTLPAVPRYALCFKTPHHTLLVVKLSYKRLGICSIAAGRICGRTMAVVVCAAGGTADGALFSLLSNVLCFSTSQACRTPAP